MQIRTDLALEAAEKAPDMPRLTEQDVEKTQLMEGEATVTRIHIHSGAGSEALGRAPGRLFYKRKGSELFNTNPL